ncbi:hypothetical protein Tco_0500726 [Tanacetum coccineum]
MLLNVDQRLKQLDKENSKNGAMMPSGVDTEALGQTRTVQDDSKQSGMYNNDDAISFPFTRRPMAEGIIDC